GDADARACRRCIVFDDIERAVLWNAFRPRAARARPKGKEPQLLLGVGRNVRRLAGDEHGLALVPVRSPARLAVANRDVGVGQAVAAARGGALDTPAVVADAVVDDRRIERRRAKAHAVERVHPDLFALERELALRRPLVLYVGSVVAETAVLVDCYDS